jgi:hypothetical protein
MGWKAERSLANLWLTPLITDLCPAASNIRRIVNQSEPDGVDKYIHAPRVYWGIRDQPRMRRPLKRQIQDTVFAFVGTTRRMDDKRGLLPPVDKGKRVYTTDDQILDFKECNLTCFMRPLFCYLPRVEA